MYNIKKSYDSKPSKNIIEEKGMTLENAKMQLDLNERLWKKNGGIVVERNDEALICEEADGSETITWTIEKLEDND